MRRLLVLPILVFLLAFPVPLRAGASGGLDTLLEALALDDLVAIMREEGLGHADELADEMFPGRGGARWKAAVMQIYDGGRMSGELRDSLSATLAGADLDLLLDFFTSDEGARIVSLELSARRALLDEAVKAASRERLEEMQADDDPRLELIGRFVEANNLVEANVAGALNANYAFYSGLADGRAFDFDLTEEQMLADVWGQEQEIRDETRDWIYSYLAMAYAPLPDAALKAYVAISETREGAALNAALFKAFDTSFTRISRELGLAAAGFIAGQDL
ncbi:DUF2059 domain-containing protein [Rhodovulum steppense]|uniref:Uncharacterized protein DUF2059 n=1 Tax=Rhodovulum steppense TaxID=540251 RepID=A0A4R1YK12_9RHOB|nr:DUF2059 domain-containing protein [Rhodovulum steppense]TCM77322.1 uncharacterized protein DUF2059 [Rhodovulum steppense]